MTVVLTIFILTALFQFPGLIHKRYWRELAVFSVFYTAAFVLCFLYALDIHLPSVYGTVSDIIENVLHMSYPHPQ